MFLTQVRILLTFESDLTLTTFDGFGTFESAESAESAESRPGRKPDVEVGLRVGRWHF